MSEKVRETPTELLIRCLEKVEGANDVVVIYRGDDDDGDECVKVLTNSINDVTFLGMVEFAKIAVVAGKD